MDRCTGHIIDIMLKTCLYACIVLNAVLNSVSVILRRPVHLSMLSWSSFNQYYAQYSFLTTGCFPTKPLSIQRTAVRGMNPVTMTIINPRTEYWPSRDRTIDLLFSSPAHYRLSYVAEQYWIWRQTPYSLLDKWGLKHQVFCCCPKKQSFS